MSDTDKEADENSLFTGEILSDMPDSCLKTLHSIFVDVSFSGRCRGEQRRMRQFHFYSSILPFFKLYAILEAYGIHSQS